MFSDGQGVSEYKRNFVVPETVSPEPTRSPPRWTVGLEQPHAHSPEGHVISAGLSSAQMALTNEPAFARKKKPVESDKKVTFTSDYADHRSPRGQVSLKWTAYTCIPLHLLIVRCALRTSIDIL